MADTTTTDKPVTLKKYTLEIMYSSVIPQGAPMPPEQSIQVANLPDALWEFEKWCDALDRSGIAEEDGGPQGWLYYTSAWDGISYGDGLVGLYKWTKRGRRPVMERA